MGMLQSVITVPCQSNTSGEHGEVLAQHTTNLTQPQTNNMEATIYVKVGSLDIIKLME